MSVNHRLRVSYCLLRARGWRFSDQLLLPVKLAQAGMVLAKITVKTTLGGMYEKSESVATSHHSRCRLRSTRRGRRSDVDEI